MQDQTIDMMHLLWLIPTAVGGFGVKFLRDLSNNVAELNKTFAVLVTRVDTHQKQIDDHEDRIREVETSGRELVS